MSLRIRLQFTSGSSLGFSIEQLATGLFYDFASTGSTAGTFTATPATLIQPLPADTGNFIGRYKTTLTSTPASVFLDGDYCITIHNTTSNNAVVAELACVMHNGDDATAIAASGDPWTTSLPGGYAPGTAGNIIGSNLNAQVSSRLASSAYTSPPSDYQQRNQPVTFPTVAPAWYTATSGSAADPWQTAVPGNYAIGTAGYVLGANLNAQVSSRLAASAYTAPPIDYQQRNQAVTLPAVAPSWYTAVNNTTMDPWQTALPGNYALGTAGYIVGTNLNAQVTSRLASSDYAAPPADYQQRNQPVTLPLSAPAWYSAPPASPSVAQIVSGVWDEPKAGHTVNGSFGLMLDAPVSSRLASSTDSPGTTQLLSMITPSRAAYLDNLNVGGTVASHSDVAAIGNNTLVRIFVPDVVQRPSSNSISRIIHLYCYDEDGSMATPDTAPTISVSDGSGTSRNSNLAATTMLLVGPGHYQSVYTINSTDPIEQLLWSFTVVQNGQTRQYGGTTEIMDVTSVDFNSTDRANLNTLLSMASTSGVVIASSAKSGFALDPSEHAAITVDSLAALNSIIPSSPIAGSIFDRIDTHISSRSTYNGGPVASVVAPVVVGQNMDKAGYVLSSAGLDSIQVEVGVNARQALSPILAASAGVLSGAGSGTITIQGGNVATTRIMAATDNLGNRSAIVLNLPQ